MNKVSIVVPVYNSELTLDRCISSILKQTYKNIEIILIDDGSIDKSYLICKKYKNEDDRVILFKQTNKGVSSARNRALSMATGNYITFCDSDDWVESNWIEELIDVCINDKYNISVCGFKWLDKVNNVKIDKLYDTQVFNQGLDINKFYKLRNADMFNVLWNKMFNLEIIRKNNIRFDEDLSLGEDLIFILQYLEKCNTKISIINKCLYNYTYKQGNNLASRYNRDLFNIYNRLFSQLYSTAKKVGVDFNIYNKEYYSNYFAALIRCLDNTLSRENEENFITKLRYNNKIIKSNEFIKCLENVSLQEYNKLYVSVLRSKQYFLFYLFCKLYQFKNKIRDKVIYNE